MSSSSPPNQPPRLLDQLQQAALDRGYNLSQAEEHVAWARRYILFHGKRHPRDLGTAEVVQFLVHLAQTEADPLPALSAAHDCLLFLYDNLLHLRLGDVPLPKPPRFLDQLRQVLRVRHYSLRTEDCYVQWARRFILFHCKRHPREMGLCEVGQLLDHLAQTEGDPVRAFA
jgi:hypothetical protein